MAAYLLYRCKHLCTLIFRVVRGTTSSSFRGGIFMNFHSMTASCAFNRDTTFSQAVTDKFSSQHFRK